MTVSIVKVINFLISSAVSTASNKHDVYEKKLPNFWSFQHPFGSLIFLSFVQGMSIEEQSKRKKNVNSIGFDHHSITFD